MEYMDSRFSPEADTWVRLCEVLHQMVSTFNISNYSQGELSSLRNQWTDVFLGRGPQIGYRAIYFSGVALKRDAGKGSMVLWVYDSRLFPFSTERLMEKLRENNFRIFPISNDLQWVVSPSAQNAN